MNPNHILITPLITEKSIKDATRHVYTFLVQPQATKNQIKTAVESVFDVSVQSVRTLKHKGKSYRVGRTRVVKTRSDTKLAKVALPQNQTIDLFDIEETK